LVAQNKTFLGNYGERWFDFADVLVPLVEFGGLHGYVRLSGSSLGSLLGISQQAAAREAHKGSGGWFHRTKGRVYLDSSICSVRRLKASCLDS